MTTQETSLLVCAATWMELRTFDNRIDPTIDQFGFGRQGQTLYLLTGVGIPQTFARLLPIVAREQPARILNLGIAGAYPNSGLQMGDIVQGESEVYGDIGFELPQPPGFQPIQQSTFGQNYRQPISLTPDPVFAGAPLGRGCTVNTCTGTEETGLRREQLFSATFETMEGAAVAHAGQIFGIPVCEIRAISNIAARRDMRPENIQHALSRLTSYFQQCREAH